MKKRRPAKKKEKGKVKEEEKTNYSESKQEARLSDGRISDEQKLEQVIAATQNTNIQINTKQYIFKKKL